MAISTAAARAEAGVALGLSLAALSCSTGDEGTMPEAGDGGHAPATSGASGGSDGLATPGSSGAGLTTAGSSSSGGGNGVAAGGTGGAGIGAGGAAGGAGGAGNGTGGAGNGAGSAAGGAGGAGSTASTGAPGTGGAPGEGGGGAGGAPDTCSKAAACGTHKWACWPMPNPAGSGLPNPASYTGTGDGVVRDNVTCLEWQQSPPTETYTWDEAIRYCDALTLGGSSDWRLPTRIEMTSIVDFTRSPAIDRAAFPGARGGFHRTSSDWILTIRQAGAGAGRDFAWAFNLSDGIVSNAYSKATAASLRCVRGNGEGEAPSSPAVAPPDQYTVVSPGEVKDNYTGLIWQQGYSSTTMTWAEAASYCAGLDLNGRAWRLPSIRELATLVDEAQVAPSIHRAMFPDTKYGARSNNWYWASHAAASNPSAAWALNFDDGFTGFNAGASGAWNHFTSAWVRCVR